jgi:hypothetical protein
MGAYEYCAETPPDEIAPATPAGLEALSGDGQVTLDWNDNTEVDILCYKVLRSEVSGGPYEVIAPAVFSSEHLDEAVVNDTAYYYVVTAMDVNHNESSTSMEVAATPMVPPGGLQLPGDSNQDGLLDMSDAIVLLGYLFLGTPDALPCGDTTGRDPANIELLDWNGDASLDLSDGIGVLSFAFLGGAPHVLGTDCVRILGCEEHCGP